MPAATVRGWLRRARATATETVSTAIAVACDHDRDLGRIQPTGTPLSDALMALGTAAAPIGRRFGLSSEHAWQLVVHITHGRLLAAPSG